MILRFAFTLIATTTLAAATLGCRTVWVHPEATAEKYSNDLFFCRYGVEQIAWNAMRAASANPSPTPEAVQPTPPVAAAPATPDRSFALGPETSPPMPAPGPVRRGWKQCMVNLGWDTSANGRSALPWRTPRPPRNRYGKR